MADFLESEAEESDDDIEEELDPHERKKLKKIKAMVDSEDEEEDDDEDRLREELKDLIDDRPIDDESDADSDTSGGGNAKRKKSDDEDELDDRLEDEDYELIEENLGVKVERKRFKRLRKLSDEESDTEPQDDGLNREVLADQLFEGGSDGEHEKEQEEERRSERSHQRNEVDQFDEEQSEESDADDFIVDDDGVPITEKKKKRKPVFTDASLQEGQDIFGVDFDYDEFDKYDEDEYEYESEVDDEYEDEGEEREKRTKKAARKKITKKSIFDIYEPSELKRGHFTDLDNEIRKTDIPERMQLREVPITPVKEGSNELDEEAEWIYNQAFCKPSISKQEYNDRRKPSTAINKIKQALDFIRNQQLEVPFISFYRKEYVQPELKINDLWKVYRFDAKWCQLLNRRNGLISLYKNMKEYQMSKLMETPDAPIPSDMRLIKDEDIERLKSVQTPEELKDVHMHFLLYYAHEIQAMQAHNKIKEREKKKREKREARMKALELAEENGEDPPPEEEEDDEPEEIQDEDKLKQTLDSGPYAMCRKAGICGLAKHFGLTPEQFAENLRDNYQRHEVDQEILEPEELAKEYVNPKFSTVEDVLHAAKFVVARQIAREPLLRKAVREIFYERAKLSVRPTKKGIKEIDENHACYPIKYLLDKPVTEITNEEFLKLHIAEQDKLLVISISEKFEGNTSSSYLDEVKELYKRDEFAKNVQEWNKLRAECVEVALNKMVLPDIRKEIQALLLKEAKDFVLKFCGQKMFSWINIAPYSVNFEELDDDYDDWDSSKGIRVMGVAYTPDHSQAAFSAIINPEGEVTDYLRTPHILKKKNAHRNDEKACKLIDLENITNFIRNKKPHAIVIGGESREALMLQHDFQDVIKQLMEEDQFPQIPVEILDNELAKIYSNSNKGHSDFRDYPPLLRQAVSLARRLQDPLVEFSQLCTADEEILCLRYHPLQDQLTKEELLDALYTQFISITNDVGVDINLAVQNPLTINLVQFICGLGPRKGQALIKILKQTNQRLENRTQLVTNCHMGPKVFINCSGFIKIDTNSLGDSTEAYVEVLDGSRVHPETYEWARKMAVDALEYDDEDANPAGALEEILESPDRLKDLDLDAFAVELERQGFGNKSITLYDIRNELNHRYKDFRSSYMPPSSEELFDMLTKETGESFYVGKMVLARVFGIGYRKPQGEQLEQANPVRNDESGFWQCPFCSKSDFPELADVWKHFDEGECPGTATGVKIFLDNGLSGFIHLKNLSDKHVKNPEERVQPGQTIHVRILKIDVDKFSVDCTSKSSDLSDKNNEFRPRKDIYYDQDLEDVDNKKENEAKKQKARQHYIKRVIVHPSFHNISYAEAMKLMARSEQGEVIVRPSSKGSDHLTVTWKVTDDIYQHIDVREEGKECAFSLGQSLWIGSEEFEDLDEIIARHVQPMASFTRDLLSYRYYRDTCGGHKDKAEELLKEEKKKNPNKIHYFLSASKNYPGKFLLSYLPRNKCKHEFVSITPDGYKFRQQLFDSVNNLLKWFKEHFKDPVPGNTPGSVRSGSVSARSSYTTPGLNETIQRVAQNLPSQMLRSLSQAATNQQTPANAYGLINTPYTPSGQTPYMTPFQTPHTSATPRYNGPFAHPGAPVSSRSFRESVSPYQFPTASPHARTAAYSSAAQESMDWQKASESWGAPRNKNSTPRDAGRITPRAGGGARYGEEYSRKTPQYDMERPSSRSSIRSGGYPTKSPRSVRTTASPHSMDTSTPFVDSTPLYDEN